MARATGTRADEIHARLRADILSGVLAPGEKLAFGQLQARYDVSTGVLREVLPRLVEQGLAVSEAQLGFRVVPVSVPDLSELTETRVFVESEVLRQSIGHGDVEWESAHSNFHRILLEACPNSRLTRIAESLRDVAEVYRCWSGRVTGPGARDVQAEHDRIAAAAVDRDVDRAVAELRRHIELTTELLVAEAES